MNQAHSSADPISPETIELAISILQGRLLGKQANLPLPAQVDHEELIRFGSQQRISQALAGGVRNMKHEGPFGAGVELLLSAFETDGAKQNKVYRTTLLNLAKRLNEAGIPMVALKGAAFLVEEKDPASWRSISDIDVLVSEAHVHRAGEALASAGYQFLLPEDGYRIEDHHHFRPMQDPVTGTAVEVHTRFVWNRADDPTNPEEIIARSSVKIVDGVEVRIPCPEHRIAHLIVHAQIGDRRFVARRIELKDILDLAIIANHYQVDWLEVEALFDRVGQRKHFLGFMASAAGILGQALPTLPLDLGPGQAWANAAQQSLANPNIGSFLMSIEILKEYISRIALRRDGLKLMFQTLADTDRLRILLMTQFRKLRK